MVLLTQISLIHSKMCRKQLLKAKKGSAALLKLEKLKKKIVHLKRPRAQLSYRFCTIFIAVLYTNMYAKPQKCTIEVKNWLCSAHMVSEQRWGPPAADCLIFRVFASVVQYSSNPIFSGFSLILIADLSTIIGMRNRKKIFFCSY